MIFPVGNGSKEDFNNNWYVATGFGEPQSYGFHEGVDINLKSGGDTDLGQPIKAIADFVVKYYHISSHPTTNFGIHYVYQINGPWGTRWVHCAHNLSVDFNTTITGSQGQKLSNLGKSGTTLAHLHFAIFKVDPATLYNKIDSIAHNLTELNASWENPIDFLNAWTLAPTPQPVITETTPIPLGGVYGSPELQKLRSDLIAKDADIIMKSNNISDLTTKIQNAKNALG